MEEKKNETAVVAQGGDTEVTNGQVVNEQTRTVGDLEAELDDLKERFKQLNAKLKQTEENRNKYLDWWQEERSILKILRPMLIKVLENYGMSASKLVEVAF